MMFCQHKWIKKKKMFGSVARLSQKTFQEIIRVRIIKKIADKITKFGKMGCLINLKLHFLDSHVNYFPENFGD